GIRVNAVCPGPILTPFHERRTRELGRTLEQYREDAAKNTILRRPGTPEEVAACILFLASDDASFVTGTLLFVAGALAGMCRASPEAAGELRREVEAPHLQLGHLLDGVPRAFLAEARFLQPAIGHEVGAPLRPPVDVQVARLHLARELPRRLQILGEDAGGQTVVGVIRERDGLVDVVERP